MKNTKLNYCLIGLVATATVINLLVSNFTYAQTQNATQNQSQILAQNTNPSNPTPMGGGMMMTQEQKDQHFIQMMIPHHQGAIDMANLALTQAKHPELKKLAQSIITSQSQEIQEMKNWYKKWYGTDVPVMNHAQMQMEHGMMMGMMNMDLTPLRNSSNFDQTFIEMMIPHHAMAVMMTAMIFSSSHPELRNLANNIIEAQTSEIEEMRQWNEMWFGRSSQ